MYNLFILIFTLTNDQYSTIHWPNYEPKLLCVIKYKITASYMRKFSYFIRPEVAKNKLQQFSYPIDRNFGE